MLYTHTKAAPKTQIITAYPTLLDVKINGHSGKMLFSWTGSNSEYYHIWNNSVHVNISSVRNLQNSRKLHLLCSLYLLTLDKPASFLLWPHTTFHVSLQARWIKALTLDLVLHLCARLSFHMLCWTKLCCQTMTTTSLFTIAYFSSQVLKPWCIWENNAAL